MIDRNHRLVLTKQSALLGISRGSVYYEPAPVPDADLALMRRLDQLHLEFPFASSRMLRGLLAIEGRKIGRRHVSTLMRRMGIQAIYRRPNTSKPAPGHRLYPYLLRGLMIDHPNHVWAIDITYIPMARGFVYLAAVMDWFARRILAWRLSNTMEASFCIDAVEEALAKHGCPQIFNTDQGSQFTSAEFTSVLINNGISISMDGKGAWRDNVFVERVSTIALAARRSGRVPRLAGDTAGHAGRRDRDARPTPAPCARGWQRQPRVHKLSRGRAVSRTQPRWT